MEEMGQPAPQPTKPEKTSGNKLAWIVAIVMTLAAGCFGYLYLTKDEAATQPQNQQTQETEDAAESTRTIYEAEVGKFSINLSNVYGVVENLDGNFEGGPATLINIGEVGNEAASVVALNPNQPFQIFAKPQDGATLDSNDALDAITSKPAVDSTNEIEFAGQPARSYDYNELFDIKSIIFINDDIVYHIILLRDDQTQSDMLSAVEAGWTFAE